MQQRNTFLLYIVYLKMLINGFVSGARDARTLCFYSAAWPLAGLQGPN